MAEFETYIKEFEENKSQGEGITIEGPSVAGIAWIPFYAETSDIPDCAYRTHPLFASHKVRPSPLSTLFVSGNPSDPSSDSNPSPASFSDRTQFLKFIESKNYRGALALDEVKLTLTESHQPLRVSFKQFGDVGYTPMRVRYNRRYLTHHDKGRGSSNANLSPLVGDDFVTYIAGSASKSGEQVSWVASC
jgi:hypothetical protein